MNGGKISHKSENKILDVVFLNNFDIKIYLNLSIFKVNLYRIYILYIFF